MEPQLTRPDTPSTRSFAPLLDYEERPSQKSPDVLFKLTKLRQRMWDKRQWKKAAAAALRDVRAVHWLAILITISALGWIAALVYLLYYLLAASWSAEFRACQPDGNFDLSQNDYYMLSVSGFFQITLAWGRFSFADAKAIDVAWDVVFGRGGQALLALISWRAFAEYTTVSMQTRPVTYRTFQAIFLQDQPGILSTFYLVRDFARSRGLQSRAMMAIMVFVAVFVLLFPTLGSAMTGYSANNDAYIQGYDGTLIRFVDFKIAGYVIHDAQRIFNMTGELVLTYPYGYMNVPTMYDGDYRPSHGFYGCKDDDSTGFGYPSSSSEDPKDIDLGDRCSMHGNVSEYVQKYGFYGLENRESTWMDRSLPAPVLNISASWLYPSLSLYGWNWTDPRTGQQPFRDGRRAAYATGNKTYPLSYLEANGSCQPLRDPSISADSVRESYEWGFSYLQLFILTVFLMAWTLCIA